MITPEVQGIIASSSDMVRRAITLEAIIESPRLTPKTRNRLAAKEYELLRLMSPTEKLFTRFLVSIME